MITAIQFMPYEAPPPLPVTAQIVLGRSGLSAMLPLPARSTLADLAQLARRYRAYDVRARHDQPRFRDIVEINPARARREAALVLRCSEEFIRVEEVVGALTSLELA